MSFIKQILLLGSFLMIHNVLFSQASLQHLLDMVVKSNPKLQAIEKRYHAALQESLQVDPLPDPKVGLGFFVSPPETRLGPQWLRVSFSQAFPWRGIGKTKADIAFVMSKEEYEQLELLKLELYYQLKMAWLDLYRLNEIQRINKRHISLLLNLEELVMTQIESGLTDLTAALSVQIQLEQLKQETQIIENEKSLSQTTINKILNRDMNTPVNITESIYLSVFPYEKATLINLLSTHPQMQIFEIKQKVVAQQRQLNHLQGRPQISLGLDYVFVGKRNDFAPDQNGRDIIAPGISANIPLNRKKYRAKDEEQKLLGESIQLERTDLMNEFEASIEAAFVRSNTAKLKHDLYTEQMQRLETSIELLTTKFETSAVGLEEILQLMTMQLDYDRKKLDAIIDSHYAKIEMERLVGEGISN
jgi:outer membrane protein TolC